MENKHWLNGVVVTCWCCAAGMLSRPSDLASANCHRASVTSLTRWRRRRQHSSISSRRTHTRTECWPGLRTTTSMRWSLASTTTTSPSTTYNLSSAPSIHRQQQQQRAVTASVMLMMLMMTTYSQWTHAVQTVIISCQHHNLQQQFCSIAQPHSRRWRTETLKTSVNQLCRKMASRLTRRSSSVEFHCVPLSCCWVKKCMQYEVEGSQTRVGLGDRLCTLPHQQHICLAVKPLTVLQCY